ncbi:MAG: hypothetical protein ACLGHY_04285, partial [Gammaproteobacteria bacterium]
EILISSLSIFTDEDRIEDLRQGHANLQLDNGAGPAATSWRPAASASSAGESARSASPIRIG